jgi:hypothetical protein
MSFLSSAARTVLVLAQMESIRTSIINKTCGSIGLSVFERVRAFVKIMLEKWSREHLDIPVLHLRLKMLLLLYLLFSFF